MNQLTKAPSGMGSRKAGAAQGITLGFCAFMPMMVVLVPPPVLPAMVANFQHIPHAATVIPMVVAIPGLLVAILSWFAGSLIDSYGRRRPYLLASALYALFGALPVFMSDFASLVVSRTGIGMVQSIIMVASSALLVDYFTEQEQRNWLTIQGAMGAVLGLVAVLLAGMAGAYGWQYAFSLYGLAIPLCLAIFLFCFEPKIERAPADSPRTDRPFPMRKAGLVAGVSLLASIFFFVFLLHAGLILKALGVASPAQIGRFIGLTAIGTPLGVILFNIVSRKLSVNVVLGLMILIMSAASVGIGLSKNATQMVVFGLFQQVGAGMVIATLIFWTAQLFLPEHRGRGFGIFNGMFFLGQFLCAPILTVAELATGGILPGFAALGCLGILGAALTVLVARQKPSSSLGMLKEQAAAP